MRLTGIKVLMSILVVVGLSMLSVSTYGAAPQSSAIASSSSASNNSTFVLGSTGLPMIPTLNPYGPYSFNYIGYGDSLTFSPLMYQMNGLPFVPALANNFVYSNGGLTVTFNLRNNVKYDNGAPFSSTDVAWTFNYIMNHSSIDTVGLNNVIKSISTPSLTQVVFNLNGTNYASIYYLVSVPIFYPAQWQNITNPFNATMTNPIGTGPYMPSQISTTGFLFVKNPYFYGTTNFAKIYFPEYSTGAAEVTALESGQINWLTGDFNPSALAWQSESPSHLYFTPPSGTLEFYMNNLVWPMNNSNFRTAVRDLINFSQLATESLQAPIYGFFPLENNNFLSSALKTEYPGGIIFKQNNSQAAKLMEKAGFHEGSDGYWQAANGTEVTLTLSGNGGAANVMEMDSTIEGWLNSFGIHANIYGPAASTFYNGIYTGKYSTGIGFFTNIINPLTGLVGYSGQYFEPIGTYAYGDYMRYNNSEVTSLINQASSEVNTSQQVNTISQIVEILVNDTPSFPVVTAISQNEIVTTGLTGINTTVLNDTLYSPVFGPLSSIAVPLMQLGFNSSTSTSPPPSSTNYSGYYVVGGIVAAVVVIGGLAYYYTRVKKKA